MAERRRAPLIGITCEADGVGGDFSFYDLVCSHLYPEAVKNAGGHPVLLPIAHRRPVLRRYLEGIDGLVIVGGDDVDPHLYGQEPGRRTKQVFARRSAFETWLYREGKRRGLPILGICYGMQLINVLEGGSLRQHLWPRRKGPRIEHQGRRVERHPVHVQAGSRLHAILKTERCQIVTGHHQAVDSPAPGFEVVATADDGVIEAIEHPDRPQLLAVQWHPEQWPASVYTRRLFDAFVRLCRTYRDQSARPAAW
jgi:putative glutamine amidotransferase